MSRRSRCFSFAAVLGLLGLAAPLAAEDKPEWLSPKADYRADTVMESADGQMRGRVFASGRKERREFVVNGREHVMILRKDRGVSWVLMPEQRMYLENAIDGDGLPEGHFAGGRLERERLGEESVNGAQATKYRVHGATPDGESFEGTMWLTAQEIPVRVVTGEGRERVRMELSNLKVGPVEASRFEIPSGYSRFELPGPAKQDLDALRRQSGR
jgi:hypothetical protein